MNKQNNDKNKPTSQQQHYSYQGIQLMLKYPFTEKVGKKKKLNGVTPEKEFV